MKTPARREGIKEEITGSPGNTALARTPTSIEDERRRGVPIAARTLTRLEADREVLEQARQQFDGFKRDKVGDSPASARAAKLLKEAKNAANANRLSNAGAARRAWWLCWWLSSHQRCPGSTRCIHRACANENGQAAGTGGGATHAIFCRQKLLPKRQVLGGHRGAKSRSRQGQAYPREI